MDKEEFLAMIMNSAAKLSNDECFPDINQDFQDLYISSKDLDYVFDKYYDVLEHFDGNAEKFYGDFFGVTCSLENVGNLQKSKARILMGEVANQVILYFTTNTHQDNSFDNLYSSFMSEMEINALQYIAGHIFHKFHSKFRAKKNWESEEVQSYLAILKAAKVENDLSQRLINAKDRGGLWRLNVDGQKMFEYCEMEFRKRKEEIQLNHKIDIKLIAKNLLQHPQLHSHYHNIYSSCDPKICKEYAVILLEELIILYLKIRAHSHAKDVKEKNKRQKKTSKKRSLRTEIKKSSSNLEMGH